MLYQLINTIKNDVNCRFVSADRFKVIFSRIDCQVRVYRIARNYAKSGIPLLSLNQTNVVSYKGFLLIIVLFILTTTTTTLIMIIIIIIISVPEELM